LAGGNVDFGDLDEELQATVIRLVRKDPARHGQLHELNPSIEAAMSVSRDDLADRIRANAEAIERNFSRIPSGRRLRGLYEQVAASPRGEPPRPIEHPERILDRFIGLSRFRLLRS